MVSNSWGIFDVVFVLFVVDDDDLVVFVVVLSHVMARFCYQASNNTFANTFIEFFEELNWNIEIIIKQTTLTK